MKTALLAALLMVLPTFASAEPPGLESWQRHHAAASRELGDWVRAYPHAARRFFAWDAEHPHRSRAFVRWSIDNPRLNIDVFVREHRGWPTFNEIAEHHRAAANAFMGWSRRHPRAAETLMNHPSGLDWAGRHLYAEHWNLEHPNR